MTVEHVRVGDVLSLQRRSIDVDPLTEYSLIGVYSFGKGIFHREPRLGSELGGYRFFAIEPGDLVLSNIQAWEGAIACARDSDAGTIGTHRFLTYVSRDERIDTAWARWFFLSEPGMDLIRKAAPGTTIRNRTLAIDRFEALEIPLPPIGEQRRIARRLDRVAVATHTSDHLSTRASEVSNALAVSMSSRPDLDVPTKLANGWTRIVLSDALAPSRDQVRVHPDIAYPNIGIYSFGRGVFGKPDIEGARTSASALFRVRTGQFIYSRLFAFEGAYAYVPRQFDGYFVSNEFPAFDVDDSRIDVRWLTSYLRSPERWAELGGASKGIGVRRQRVPVDAVLAYEVWAPPIAEQRRIVAAIDKLDEAAIARVGAQLRARTLVTASLNELFRGAS